MPFPGNARPPDGLPTGPSRACIAGSPTARCDSKRQELARDVPAGQFVEREGDPPGDQLLKKRVEDLAEAGEEERQNMRDGPGWRDAIPALWIKVASYGLPMRRIRDL